MSRSRQVEEVETRVRPSQVRRVRSGHGANCSSIGSVVDTLFAAATVGAALFAAVVAALGSEPVRVVGAPEDERAGPAPSEQDDAAQRKQPPSRTRRTRTTSPPKRGRS